MTAEPLGLAVIDKPPGMTSHDVVSAVRRALQLKRVGHAGTLDPPATGVLLVGVGRATRLLQFLQGTDKDYAGTFALGTSTTTLDATGEVTATYDMAGVDDAAVRAAAAALTGELDQVPPMVSAVKVDGRRLHELARDGIEVERAPRRVTVTAFDVARRDDVWAFSVSCSSGTFVRSLVDDLGRALGGAAHLTSLRRTRVGRFTLADATPLDAFADRARANDVTLLSPAEMVRHLGIVRVTDAQAEDLLFGRAIALAAGAVAGTVAACRDDSTLLAVGDVDGDGVFRPTVVLS